MFFEKYAFVPFEKYIKIKSFKRIFGSTVFGK